MPVFFTHFTKLVLLLLLCDFSTGTRAAESVRIWQATPTRLYEVRGSQRRMLSRLEQFLEQQQWDDAFDIATRILETDSPTVIVANEPRYVSLHEHCHQLIAQLPAEQLAHYRELVDQAASVRCQRGIATRDEFMLRRIVDQSFCSSWGDNALWALGELALERGDYALARRYWKSLSPQLVATANGLAYPDMEFALADVRARLLLVSIRAGDWPRAAVELAKLQALHPKSRGRLAGRAVVYAEHLALLLRQARAGVQPPLRANWSTFAGGPTRMSATNSAVLGYEQRFRVPLDAAVPAFPIVANGLVVYRSPTGIQAVELATGEEIFAVTGEVFVPVGQGALGQDFGTITAAEKHVFGALVRPLGPTSSRASARATSVLWGIDLERDGALSLRVASEEANVAYAEAPLVERSKLYVALRAYDRTARAGIGCYDLSQRRWSWQRWHCRANTPATGWTQDLASSLLTMDAGIIYHVTNLGAVSAVRADDGQVLWIHTYDRIAAPLTAAGSCAYYRGPNPGIYHRGRLFALPTDSKNLMALDAMTGWIHWQHPLTSENGLLVGASDGKILLADQGLRILEARNGQVLAKNHELILQGRAVIVGEQIFWPSAGKIHILNLATGTPQAPPVQLPAQEPAHLIVAGDFLVAAQPSQLIVYQAIASPTTDTNITRLP